MRSAQWLVCKNSLLKRRGSWHDSMNCNFYLKTRIFTWFKVNLVGAAGHIGIFLWWAFFCNCGLGYLLPRYSLMILGRRVRIGLIVTHPKPACAQTRTPLLRPWTRAHGRGNCYKKVMEDRCNMTIMRRICLLLARRKQKS